MNDTVKRLLRELDRDGTLDEYFKSKQQLWDPRNTVTVFITYERTLVTFFRRVHWKNIELLKLTSHLEKVFPSVWGIINEEWITEKQNLHTYNDFHGFVGLNLGYFPTPRLEIWNCSNDIDHNWGETGVRVQRAFGNTMGSTVIMCGRSHGVHHQRADPRTLEDFRNSLDRIPITTWENLWETPTNTREIKFDL